MHQLKFRNVREAMISAHRIAEHLYADVPGAKIPLLLSIAFEVQFGEKLPKQTSKVNLAKYTIESLSTLLDSLLPVSLESPHLELMVTLVLTDPKAVGFVQQAKKLLTTPAELSMNILLEDGEDLPIRLHTLLQGTIWAIMMAGGADPDLDDSEDERYHPRPANKTYTSTAKCLWFLCKKFFYTCHVAIKDGTAQTHHADDTPMFTRLYAGRLFTRGSNIWHTLGVRTNQKAATVYAHVRMPPVVDIHVARDGVLALSPKGVFTWGTGYNGTLGHAAAIVHHNVFDYEAELDDDGIEPEPIIEPRRVKFTACPKVDAYERTLPPWHKGKLVLSVAMTYYCTVIVTRAGTVACGLVSRHLNSAGPDTDTDLFHPCPMPQDFRAARVIAEEYVAVVTDDEGNQMIGGRNDKGQLGLGHSRRLGSFAPLPYPVEVVAFGGQSYNIFYGDKTLRYAGTVFKLAEQFLGGPKVRQLLSTARPLVLPFKVKAVLASYKMLAFIRADGKGTFASDESGNLVHWDFAPDQMLSYFNVFGAHTFFFKRGADWYGVGDNRNHALSSAPSDWVHAPVPVPSSAVSGRPTLPMLVEL
ncbi:hypothetical protein J8273_8866 [Carpediemonas membranifera]|uniref:Uncharacterized protein n=1 Tax=Carpediemonas membranifera TaxID=201153 RepID=A0A8J6DYN1_9EUKA|nr:hypothetical protein J8273_8866 [Carpediemonas membranifera]|eukprot:KAG9389573.1 hypothetical protein J8273_8866 [Carpediemonas membranifera]